MRAICACVSVHFHFQSVAGNVKMCNLRETYDVHHRTVRIQTVEKENICV